MYVAPYAVSVRKDELTSEDYEAMRELGGANAGICYLDSDSHVVEPIPQDTLLEGVIDNDYFASQKAIGEKALTRFRKCIEDKHHSVADHVWVELRLSGISKMLAMWLNLLRFSNTSEKSGRYTHMISVDDETEEAYDKWEQHCLDYIDRQYPNMPQFKKAGVAKENARYMLGVFDHITTMGYSTSWRCWNYIIYWADHCWEWVYSGGYTEDTLPPFYTQFCEELEELRDELLVLGLQVDGLIDEKYPFPNVLHYPVKGVAMPFGAIQDEYAMTDMGWAPRMQGLNAFAVANGTCTFAARMSYAGAAQLLRHRRLHVQLYPCLDGMGISVCNDDVQLPPDKDDTLYMHRQEYFVRPAGFVEDTADWRKWVSDLSRLTEDDNPRIGATVWVKVSGSLADILAVITERSCGSAQVEIRQLAQQLVQRMIKLNAEDKGLDYADRILLHNFQQKIKSNAVRPYTRCMVNKCKKPCMWIKDAGYTL